MDYVFWETYRRRLLSRIHVTTIAVLVHWTCVRRVSRYAYRPRVWSTRRRHRIRSVFFFYFGFRSIAHSTRETKNDDENSSIFRGVGLKPFSDNTFQTNALAVVIINDNTKSNEFQYIFDMNLYIYMYT